MTNLYSYEETESNDPINWSEFIAKTSEGIDVTNIIKQAQKQEAECYTLCQSCGAEIPTREECHDQFGNEVCEDCNETAKRLRVMGVTGIYLYRKLFPKEIAVSDEYIESLDESDY